MRNPRSDPDDVAEMFRLHLRPAADQVRVHWPFLVFLAADLQASVVETEQELLALDDAAVVYVQWPGKFRSDFFRFTLGQYKTWLQKTGLAATIGS